MLGAGAGGKVALVAMVAPSVVERGVKAGDVVQAAAKVVGGGGGGRDTMARAGGRDPEKLDRGDERRTRGDRARPGLSVRVLALDYGAARCGVALSDPTGVLATPVEAVGRPGTRRGCGGSLPSFATSTSRTGRDRVAAVAVRRGLGTDARGARLRPPPG